MQGRYAITRSRPLSSSLSPRCVHVRVSCLLAESLERARPLASLVCDRVVGSCVISDVSQRKRLTVFLSAHRQSNVGQAQERGRSLAQLHAAASHAAAVPWRVPL